MSDDKVFFPNDHLFAVKLIDKETGAIAHEEEMRAEFLHGAVLRIRITWNALAVSGGSRWVRPSDGRTFPRGLTWDISTLHPDTGELVSVDAAQLM